MNGWQVTRTECSTSLQHRPSLCMLKSAMQQHFLWQAMLAMSGSASMITMAPGLYPRQSGPNSASCDALTSFEAACASATPGFLTLGPADQYSCLCFTSSTFA